MWLQPLTRLGPLVFIRGQCGRTVHLTTLPLDKRGSGWPIWPGSLNSCMTMRSHCSDPVVRHIHYQARAVGHRINIKKCANSSVWNSGHLSSARGGGDFLGGLVTRSALFLVVFAVVWVPLEET